MKRISYFAIGIIACIASAAQAAIIDIIDSPINDKGQLQFEYRGVRTSDSSKIHNNEQEHEFDIGYGFTDDFQMTLVGLHEREPEEQSHFSFGGLQAIYTTTRQGEWWLNSGFLAEYDAATQADNADNFEGRLLLSRKQGPFDITANFTMEHEFGPYRETGANLVASFSAFYDIGNEHLKPGLAWFDGIGKANELSERNEQYLGPTVTGSLAKFAGSEINYTTGYYWGLTRESANQGVQIDIAYGIQF